jgi:rubrerythrin
VSLLLNFSLVQHDFQDQHPPRKLKSIQTSCAVIITRPPEIIACMKLVIDSTDLFVIFDSHSRPRHPDGAVFILNTSLHRSASHLRRILPVDRRLLSEDDLQWQAQLLSNFSGHVFVSRGSDIIPPHLLQTMTEASLTILSMRAEMSDLKLKNAVLTSENDRLGAEILMTNESHAEGMKMTLSSSRRYGLNSHTPRSTLSRTNTVAGPSQVSNRRNPTAHKQRESGKTNRHENRAQDQPARNNKRHHFECRICMEQHLEDSVARIDSCGHVFCRECVRGYVGFKLDENRFPILCPVCMTDNEKGEPGGA